MPVRDKSCYERRKELNAQRRANGLCVRCGEPVKEGQMLCEKHYLLQVQSAMKALANPSVIAARTEMATKKRRDLTGQRFGRLVAIKDVGSNRAKRRLWLCHCDCGNDTVVSTDSLVQGNTLSCGCLQREKRVSANTKHGYYGTRLYNIWKGMLTRCRDPQATSYKWYGAKGIYVCDEWHEFEPFKDWALSHGYRDDLTIDRLDNSGCYCPENCRWATPAQQTANRDCMKGA